MKNHYFAAVLAGISIALITASSVQAQDARLDILTEFFGDLSLSDDGQTVAARCRAATGPVQQQPCLWTLDSGYTHIDFPDSLLSPSVEDISGDGDYDRRIG